MQVRSTPFTSTDMHLWAVAILCLFSGVLGHGDHDAELAQKLKNLKGKWDAVDVIRDPEHIKEDIKTLMVLTENKTISLDETYFYFIRMNDFDNNDGLDGIEIYHAMFHVFEHYKVNESSYDEDIIKQVDMVLENDLNQDGFMSYAEYKDADARRAAANS